MKRILALTLAMLLMLGMLSACSSAANTPAGDAGTDQPASTNAPADESQPGSPSDSTEPDEPQPAPVETDTHEYDSLNVELPKGFAENTIPYPICDPGEITLEYWRTANDQTLQRAGEPFADNYAWNKIEEVTGIQVKFMLFSSASYATQFSLMLASEDYPDVAESMYAGTYSGGVDQAIEDGVYTDIAPYVEEYAPNFYRWVNLSAGNRKAAYTDSGRMPYICMTYDRAQSTFLGYGIRRDWLQDLGLDMPTTIDEWHDVLLAFKEHKTAGGAAPMDLFSGGFTPSEFINGAYNVSSYSNCGLIVKDGVLESSMRSQGLYDYLSLMRSWFAEGLIDPDFSTHSFFWNTSRMANGESGVIPVMYTQVGTYMADSGQADENCYIEIMPVPTLDGTERHVYAMGEWACGMGAGGAIIFAAGDHVKEAIRWCDYRYSEEGYMLTNYGILGETYDLDENGAPHLFDLLVNNPDGLSAGFAQEVYLIHNGSVVFLLDREENQASDEGRRYNELWRNIGDWTLSGSLTYNAEEAEERGRLVNDLSTYISEFSMKIIMGQEDLNESSWNAFQEQLTAMGLDRVVEISQAAYDRFLAR